MGGGIMARSTLSAAILLAAVAGLTGCSTTDAHFVSAPVNGIAIVAVPDSDIAPWYYRHEAMQYIKENNPNFKESDIIAKGIVASDERIVGLDGKAITPRVGSSGDKQYQIAFRVTTPTSRVVVGPAPTTTMPGMMPNNGMPMNTVVPVGGVQNTNPPYSGMNTTPPPYGGVQNVNTMTPNQMQQPNSQMIPPPPYQPAMPSSGPGLYNR
jgi:hypothetical protein